MDAKEELEEAKSIASQIDQDGLLVVLTRMRRGELGTVAVWNAIQYRKTWIERIAEFLSGR